MLREYGPRLCQKISVTAFRGMRQRAALIRTLALRPAILLLDGSSALDYQTRLAVSDDIYKIIKEQKNCHYGNARHSGKRQPPTARHYIIRTAQRSKRFSKLHFQRIAFLCCKSVMRRSSKAILILYGRSLTCMSSDISKERREYLKTPLYR